MNLDISKIPSVKELDVHDYVKQFRSFELNSKDKIQRLQLAFSMIDLTTLSGTDTQARVEQLCNKALNMAEGITGVSTVAAVCVYPNFVGVAAKELANSSVQIASVAGGFPSGQTSLAIKKDETKFALDQGAHEIDIVISRGKFLAGEFSFVHDEIAELKAVCGKRHLKVILETGELETLSNVRMASEIAIAAGADFIKTSTGKISPAATLESTYVMLQAIADYYKQTGKMIGMKPAGGIADSHTALQYLALLEDVLGADWMNNKLFRFGASRLADDIVKHLKIA